LRNFFFFFFFAKNAKTIYYLCYFFKFSLFLKKKIYLTKVVGNEELRKKSYYGFFISITVQELQAFFLFFTFSKKKKIS